MTGSTRIPAIDVTGTTGAIMKVAARKMLGKVPDSLGVLWNHPAVFKDLITEAHEASDDSRTSTALLLVAFALFTLVSAGLG